MRTIYFTIHHTPCRFWPPALAACCIGRLDETQTIGALGLIHFSTRFQAEQKLPVCAPGAGTTKTKTNDGERTEQPGAAQPNGTANHLTQPQCRDNASRSCFARINLFQLRTHRNVRSCTHATAHNIYGSLVNVSRRVNMVQEKRKSWHWQTQYKKHPPTVRSFALQRP